MHSIEDKRCDVSVLKNHIQHLILCLCFLLFQLNPPVSDRWMTMVRQLLLQPQRQGTTATGVRRPQREGQWPRHRPLQQLLLRRRRPQGWTQAEAPSLKEEDSSKCPTQPREGRREALLVPPAEPEQQEETHLIVSQMKLANYRCAVYRRWPDRIDWSSTKIKIYGNKDATEWCQNA